MEEGVLEKYIGVKIIKAEPQECQQDIHNSKKGDPGYLVEYEDGYQSWSPAGVFEKAYRKTNGLTFGLALEAMKLWKKVARKGWNGKGIFIYLHQGEFSNFITIDTTGLQTDNPDAPRCVIPWVASQTDMLCEDWEIV